MESVGMPERPPGEEAKSIAVVHSTGKQREWKVLNELLHRWIDYEQKLHTTQIEASLALGTEVHQGVVWSMHRILGFSSFQVLKRFVCHGFRNNTGSASK